jgi:hypothetical protein
MMNRTASPARSLRHRINPKFDPDQTFTTAVSGPLKLATLGFRGRLVTFEATSVSVSVRMIIDLNIQHYRDLLKTETDASKRQTISKLLFEEEVKLANLLTQEGKNK